MEREIGNWKLKLLHETATRIWAERKCTIMIQIAWQVMAGNVGKWHTDSVPGEEQEESCRKEFP